MANPCGSESAIAQISAKLDQALTLLEAMEKLMASQNSVIQQLATDFAKFQTDFAGFAAAVKAFIASATSGNTGTVLSAADAQTLQGIDTALQGLDTTIQGITVPAPPATSAS